MLDKDDLWLLDEAALDEPADPFAMPEIREHLVRDRRDDEVGLRALLEHPEALSKAWRRPGSSRKRAPRKMGRRHPDVLRAA